MPLPMNVDEVKRNETFMAMHAAQKVAAQSGRQPVANPNRRQKIATGIGVAAVVAVLVVLSALRVI